jgi:threonyl-tRNA synthetase
MSLNFVIIPVTQMFKDSAYDLQEQLHSVIKRNLCVKIDEEYDSLIHNRINDWEDKDYDIITIGPSYIENNQIVYRSNEKGSNPENMLVDDFIELVNSLEDDTPSDKSEENKGEEMNDSWCFIM